MLQAGPLAAYYKLPLNRVLVVISSPEVMLPDFRQQ